jgi:hypothetical protein
MGFTYNARFELNFSAKTIRTIWRPPQNITLADLVLWFPTAPSEWVLRREWANKLVDLIEISQIWTGGEIVYLGILFLSGCKFGLVDRVLNYRRHHSRRVFKDLSGGCRCEILAQEIIFNDPRCPEDVLALRDTAHSNIYAFWAVIAFFQNETSLGQSFLRQAVHHRPDILAGNPCDLVDKFLVGNCSDDENEDYPTLLKKVFDQLPPEMALISEQFDWALARGFLLRGARAAIWDRPEDAQKYFQLAREMNAEVDDSFLSHLTRSLMDYEKEFGSYSAQQILKNIESYLQDMTDTRDLQQLKGLFAMNYAFQCYQNGEYRKVPKQVLKAFLIDSRNVYNRGLHSVLFRSIIKSLSLKNSKEALEVYSYHTQ